MREVGVPPGWCVATIMDISTTSGGGTPSKADASYWSGGNLPWVSPKDMKRFLVNSSEDAVTTKALDRLTLVPADSVLVVVRSGILSRTLPVAINVVPVTINQDMRAFVPSPSVETRYVALQLIANEREILNRCAKDGTTVASIEGPALASYPFAVAPAAEQTRIVDKLEELLSDLDAGVAELKAAQKKLAQYRQSLLKAAVEGRLTESWRAEQGNAGASAESGAQLLDRILRERRARWEAKQLAKFESQGKAPAKGWQEKYPEPMRPKADGLPAMPLSWAWASVDELSPDDLANGRSVPTASVGAKVLRLNALKSGSVDLTKFKLGAWSDDEAKQFAVVDGDLLIARGNGSLKLVGRAGLVAGVGEQVAYPNTMIRLRLVASVVRPAWIGLLWNAARTRSHIERQARTSAGIYKISQPDIISVVVPVPPLAEQDHLLAEIAREGEQLVRTEQSIETALRQSAAQRKNILQSAFSGQLVPQDPNDEPASVLLARIRAERAAQETNGTRSRLIKKAVA